MLHIVIATRNQHKFRELKGLLRVPGIRWHSLEEFPRVREVKETGRTFEANAALKALAAAKATGCMALADDSGVEVDALHGAPGILSARFAGSHGDDGANNRKLLRRMKQVPARRRSARYVCSLALTSARRVIAVTRGSWYGRIAAAPRGSGGFGYDPIVWIPRFGKTVAQLPKTVKRKYSHRSVAARRMLATLRRLNAASR